MLSHEQAGHLHLRPPDVPEYTKQFGENPARVIYHMDQQPRSHDIAEPSLIRAYLGFENNRN